MVWCWGAHDFENLANLALAVLAWEEGLHLDHLSYDTSSCPHINLLVVKCRTEDELRCTIISRTDVRNRGISVVHSFGRAEITQFDFVAILIDQDVLRLHITMNDPLAMQVAQTPKQLPSEHLHGYHRDKHVRNRIGT